MIDTAAVRILGIAVALATSAVAAETTRNTNPYANVDWDTVQHIHTASHNHMTNQETLDRAVRTGLRFLTISNYYPSAPWWPMREYRNNQFWTEHTHPVVVDGKLTPGPFNWNKIILDPETGWADELPADIRDDLPVTVGDHPFTNIPDDILEAPNAEHHGFTNTNAHACAPGSAYQSGTVDKQNRYHTRQHGYAIGTGQTWQDAFTGMFEDLIVPDGGGVTINHPTWSGLPRELVIEMLDYDPRVLGIEIFNNSTRNSRGPQAWVGNETLWDEILATGRQCYGFFVPDHLMRSTDDWKGRNVLLVDEFTVEACLRAYRQGRFYGAIKGTDLRFTKVHADNDAVTVKTNGANRIEFYTEAGLAEAARGAEAVFALPKNEDGEPAVTFVRARALDGSGEIIYAQPIVYGSSEK